MLNASFEIFQNFFFELFLKPKKAEDDAWKQAHRQFADLADIAQEDVSLHLTAVDYKTELEKKIIKDAQVVIIASEHDFIPYDRKEI